MKTKAVMILVAAMLVISVVMAGCAAEEAPGPAPTPAPAETVHEWAFQCGSPAGSDNYVTWNDFADMVRSASSGRIDITVYGQSEIVPTPRESDGVQEGVLDFATFDVVGERGVIPTAGAFGGYPGGPDIETMDMWFYMGGGAELMEKAWSEAGYTNVLLPRYSWNTAGEIWAQSTVKLENSPDALNGLKMRCKGDAGEIMPMLGCSTVMLSGSEIYQALDRGVIDLAECCSANMNWELAFHEVCPYAYFSLTRAPIQNIQNCVNRDSWDALGTDLQDLFIIANDWWAKRRYQQVYQMDLQAFDRMLDYGVQCMDVPPLLDQALLDAAAEFYVGQRAADPFLDEIMTSQENFRKVFETLKTLDNPNAFITEY